MACGTDLFSKEKRALEQHEKGVGGGVPTEDIETAPVAECQGGKTEEACLESGLKGRDGGLDGAITQST